MPHLYTFVLIAATLTASWLGMQAVHELGHVFGAWKTGGQVERVVLQLFGISRTDLFENPNPLIVTWAGPFVGVLAPLALWLGSSSIDRLAISPSVPLRLTRPIRVPLPSFLLRFFAGFCLVANGLYIGLGSFTGVGDCGDLLRHGASAWQLWLFGAITSPAGLALWHRQGEYFGLGPRRRTIGAKDTFAALAVCLVLVAVFLIQSARRS